MFKRQLMTAEPYEAGMTRHKIIDTLALVGITIAVLAFVWGATGEPMMRNYAECGTVFLCSAQP